MRLSKEQIKEIIPHRDPFLFVDSVEKIECVDNAKSLVDLEKGVVTSRFYVNPDLHLFSGHFPGNPVLPGVLQTEIIAQSACLLLAPLVRDYEDKTLKVALLKVEQAKFRRPVTPGMNLQIEACCIRTRGNIMEYQGKIYNDRQLMSQANIMASVDINQDNK
ncbi:MAG: beta-hydroxyacyl-ACP dehydratase [Halobacteriovoraceae bacterium]|nr:beta-hydroxyacyl-ACP dehydratase [Halobacteriovoraceae bacterium]